MITNSTEETMEEGKEFAKTLHGGEIIALQGDLGAGKTTFMKGLAEGLKIADTITSPTFVMLKPYDGKIKEQNIQLIHVDAYRVEGIGDIKSVGIEDYLDRPDVILAIEWPEKIRQILPKDRIAINFKNIDEHSREITILNKEDPSDLPRRQAGESFHEFRQLVDR